MVCDERSSTYRIVAETLMDIIYITDSKLDEHIASRCRELLPAAFNGNRIISVSQSPLDFGENICVGKIGRSSVSMEKQVLAGLNASSSDVVAIAEHDCIYSQEHFEFVPSDLSVFWYNTNLWVLQYETGVFSYRPRKVFSQLVCGRQQLIRATEDKLAMVSDSKWDSRRPIGEPGVADLEKSLQRCKTDRLKYLMKQYVTRYTSAQFTTTIPNIDIRHGGNFTGGRHGRKKTLKLEPFGYAKDLL
jgi:hypothetical protein